jgi:hypothetical protein
MIIAMLVIGVVVSMPIVATVIVSVASRREDKAWSLRDPAHGVVQDAARRIVDFHSESRGWPLSSSYGQVRRSYGQVRSSAPAPRSVSQPRRSVAADSPKLIATSDLSIRTAV